MNIVTYIGYLLLAFFWLGMAVMFVVCVFGFWLWKVNIHNPQNSDNHNEENQP